MASSEKFRTCVVYQLASDRSSGIMLARPSAHEVRAAVVESLLSIGARNAGKMLGGVGYVLESGNLAVVPADMSRHDIEFIGMNGDEVMRSSIEISSVRRLTYVEVIL